MPLLPDWAERFQVDIPTTESTAGIYVGRDGDDAIINFRDSSAVVRMATSYRPIPGEPVTLTWLDGKLRVTGPVRARSAIGTITQLGYPTVGVQCDGRDYQLGYSLSLQGELVVGDVVAIVWAGGGYVSDKVTITPDTSDRPRLTTDQVDFTLNLFATASGTARGDQWQPGDVLHGPAPDDDSPEPRGAWFYGDTLRTSLDDQATIQSVEVYVPVRFVNGLTTFSRHGDDAPPTDGLDSDDAELRDATTGWVSLPVAWAEQWRDEAGGIAITSGNFAQIKGIQADRQSGKLRIRGRQ